MLLSYNPETVNKPQTDNHSPIRPNTEPILKHDLLKRLFKIDNEKKAIVRTQKGIMKTVSNSGCIDHVQILPQNLDQSVCKQNFLTKAHRTYLQISRLLAPRNGTTIHLIFKPTADSRLLFRTATTFLAPVTIPIENHLAKVLYT